MLFLGCSDSVGVVEGILPTGKFRFDERRPAAVRELVGVACGWCRVRAKHVLHTFGIRLVVPLRQVEYDVGQVLYRTVEEVITGSGVREPRLLGPLECNYGGWPAA